MTTGLTRWNPTSDLFRDRMSRLMDEAFGDMLRPLSTATEDVSNRRWMPPVDIKETRDDLSFVFDLPGLGKEDVSLTIEKNVLTVAGERRFQADEEKESFHRIERGYGAFSRSFSLPSNLKPDKVGARFDQGVLTVTIPKGEESKPRKIEIK